MFGQVPAIERDLYWEPRTIGEIKRQSPERCSRRPSH